MKYVSYYKSQYHTDLFFFFNVMMILAYRKVHETSCNGLQFSQSKDPDNFHLGHHHQMGHHPSPSQTSAEDCLLAFLHSFAICVCTPEHCACSGSFCESTPVVCVSCLMLSVRCAPFYCYRAPPVRDTQKPASSPSGWVASTCWWSPCGTARPLLFCL